jgi:DNA-binding response OmpR family regulator
MAATNGGGDLKSRMAAAWANWELARTCRGHRVAERAGAPTHGSVAAPEDGVQPIPVALLDRNERFLRSLEQFLGGYPDEISVVGAQRTVASVASYLDWSGASLILIGVGLAGAKTLELISQTRATCPTAGIIALVLMEAGDAESARAAGADDVVVKDRIVQGLLPAVRRIAERQRGDSRCKLADAADT